MCGLCPQGKLSVCGGKCRMGEGPGGGCDRQGRRPAADEAGGTGHSCAGRFRACVGLWASGRVTLGSWRPGAAFPAHQASCAWLGKGGEGRASEGHAILGRRCHRGVGSSRSHRRFQQEVLEPDQQLSPSCQRPESSPCSPSPDCDSTLGERAGVPRSHSREAPQSSGRTVLRGRITTQLEAELSPGEAPRAAGSSLDPGPQPAAGAWPPSSRQVKEGTSPQSMPCTQTRLRACLAHTALGQEHGFLHLSNAARRACGSW